MKHLTVACSPWHMGKWSPWHNLRGWLKCYIFPISSLKERQKQNACIKETVINAERKKIVMLVLKSKSNSSGAESPSSTKWFCWKLNNEECLTLINLYGRSAQKGFSTGDSLIIIYYKKLAVFNDPETFVSTCVMCLASIGELKLVGQKIQIPM